MTKELETWFSGFGLADIGMQAAGLTSTFAVEFDNAIANVYRDNLGNHCLTADVRNFGGQHAAEPTAAIDRGSFWFHVSPPCVNASVAKADAGETELDIEMAQAIVRGIERRSPWFSLENVWGYRSFESFRLILEALGTNGYNLSYWHLNSANYGVPQTRKRLILCASRVKRVVQPHPTHAKEPDLFLQPWQGWYGAIADLIPFLPETQFAPWQLERLPAELKASCLVESKNSNQRWGKGYRGLEEPAFSVTTDHRLSHQPKACLVPDGNASSFSLRYQDEPSRLIGDQRSNGGRSLSMRDGDQPCFTVEASKSGVHAGRALLVDGIANNHGATVTAVTGDRPSYTVKASAYKQSSRAYIPGGRVVAITPECIARFQSMPSWYRLPEKASLACKGIGNGFPCRLAQALVEAQNL